MTYVDTSVLIAAFTPEARTAAVQEWLAAQSPEELNVSEWTLTEFSSALSIKVRTGQLSALQRADVLGDFTALTETSFTVWPVSQQDFRVATRMANQHDTGLRAGDGLHLAVAAAHGAHLVSLDKTLIDAAVAFGVYAISV